MDVASSHVHVESSRLSNQMVRFLFFPSDHVTNAFDKFISQLIF